MPPEYEPSPLTAPWFRAVVVAVVVGVAAVVAGVVADAWWAAAAFGAFGAQIGRAHV